VIIDILYCLCGVPDRDKRSSFTFVANVLFLASSHTINSEKLTCDVMRPPINNILNSRRIFMKRGIKFMPLEVTPYVYNCRVISNINMVLQTSKVGEQLNI
jgi:hypothetical protein